MKNFFMIVLCMLLCITTVSIGVSIFDIDLPKDKDKETQVTMPVPSVTDGPILVSSDSASESSVDAVPVVDPVEGSDVVDTAEETITPPVAA